MTLSGRNGSGKTTLLRMLAGDATVDLGRLALQKGAKVSLHDQRPPRERGLTLRDYVLSGATEVVALERELERLERAMAGGTERRRDARAPTAPLRSASSTTAATAGVTARWSRCAASGSSRATSTARFRPSPVASSRAARWPAR